MIRSLKSFYLLVCTHLLNIKWILLKVSGQFSKSLAKIKPKTNCSDYIYILIMTWITDAPLKLLKFDLIKPLIRRQYDIE